MWRANQVQEAVKEEGRGVGDNKEESGRIKVRLRGKAPPVLSTNSVQGLREQHQESCSSQGGEVRPEGTDHKTQFDLQRLKKVMI